MNVESIKINCNYKQDLGFILTNSYEQYNCNIFKQITQKGDIIIDVGANIGFLSLYFAKLTGKNGKVYSFEPLSSAYNLMSHNLELNKKLDKSDICLYKLALGNSNEIMDI